jgi:hypothetical protein
MEVNRNDKIIVPIEKLNEFLGCTLCKGYFREAHTITECLHTFCKECLIDEFAKSNYGKSKHCPTCNVNLGCTAYITSLSSNYLTLNNIYLTYIISSIRPKSEVYL